MLLKWIVCDVEPSNRVAFGEAQQAWGAIGSADGLLGQTGGWDRKSGRACVVGAWASTTSYEAFMGGLHDEVIAGSRQEKTYVSSRVTIFDGVMEMAGHDGAGAPFERAGFVRVADCHVHPERVAHFIQVQREVWAPGMAACAGMLGGWFGRAERGERFLVVTLWENEACHEAYASGPFATLRGKAGAAEDLRSITGYQVVVEQGWKVSPLQGSTH